MRKKIRARSCAIFFAVLMIFSMLPLPARAVDPVSAATMANAFAQAITSYGASQGVSMMFDVADTSQIGETVHQLWKRFRADQQTADDYETIAAAVWPSLYHKVMVGASAVLGIRLAAERVADLDAFWNWVLSGPAEMTKVDNQYYEWQLNQSGTVDRISVYSDISAVIGSYNFSSLPTPIVSNRRNADVYAVQFYDTAGNNVYYSSFTNDRGYDVALIVSDSSASVRQVVLKNGASYSDDPVYLNEYGSSGVYYATAAWLTPSTSGTIISSIPSYDSTLTISGFESALAGGSTLIESASSVSVQPYVGDAVPQDVYIPDNDDVNYQPLPYVGGLDIPWDDLLYGDGTESMTDAQSQAASESIDNVITGDGTVTLAGDQALNPDVPSGETIGDPDDYQVPGLADVFPFCIPFDIYNFVSALAAEPEAPHFTAQLAFPEAIGGTQEIDLDFDTPTFNRLAQLLRLLELLAFSVGLALLTRSMFIRG